MGTRDVTIWSCDRCPCTEERPRSTGGDSPGGWISVQSFTPPRAGVDADGASRRVFLCRSCASDYQRFITKRYNDTPGRAA